MPTKRHAEESGASSSRAPRPRLLAFRLAVAGAAGLLAFGTIGLLGAGAAGAQTITASGSATGAPANGSVLVADSAVSEVFEVAPGGGVTDIASPESPSGVAVDSVGDVFVTTQYANYVEEFSAANPQSLLEIGPGAATDGDVNDQFNGFSEPEGVATDAAGNVYVADTGNGAIEELTASSDYQDEVTLVSSFSLGMPLEPYGVATDAAGDVFFSDQASDAIWELPFGASTPVELASTNYDTPYGIAVDADDDVYVAMNDQSQIAEVVAGSGTLTPIISDVSAFNVVVDSSGDVYVPDQLTNDVLEFPPGGGASTDVASGFYQPQAIALYPPLGAKLPLVATVNGTATYGGAPSYTVTYSGFVDGQSAADVTGTLVCGTAFTASGALPTVGAQPLTSCTGLAAPAAYQLTYKLGTLTVGPAPLTITPATTTMDYGNVPTIEPSYSGFVGLDSAASLTTPPTCTTSALPTSNAGSSFPTSCSGAVDPNYTISYKPGTITVVPEPVTITASSPTMTYGATTIPSVSAIAVGLANGQSLSSAFSPAPTCQTASTVTSTTPPGTVQTTCSGGGANPNYQVTYVPGTFTIAKAPLTITAVGGSATYGGTIPTITDTITGEVNGQGLTTQPTCSTTATASSAAGTYPATCTGAASSYYTISYVPGSVVIGPKVLTVTASSPTFTYGGASLPSVTPSFSGFVNGDSAASLGSGLSCTTTAKASSPAGAYATSCSGAVDPNYTIDYVPGTLTISPAPLTVTAASATMAYGGAVPSITPSYSGFVNGDTAASLTTQPTCTTTAKATSAVGTYASTCTGAADPNYTITYVAGVVTVTNATLVVSASGASVYGSALGAITPSYTGFVGGDTVASLSKAAACTTTATRSSPAGSYPITCSGVVDANYLISYVTGTYTITPAPLTITASSTSIALGGATPSITPSYSGFVNGDSAASLTTQPTCTTPAGPSASAGTYASTCSGALDPNYTITYVPGTVKVGSVTLTVSANSASMLFGQPVPRLTTTISGLPAGVTLATSGITGEPSCTTTATSASPGGTYPITCTAGTLQGAGYSFAFVAGTLTVGYSEPCITGWYWGSLTVGAGQSICVGPGAFVLGGIQVNRGGSLDVESAGVSSSINAASPGTVRVCSSVIGGSVTVEGATGLVTIGDPTMGCGGDVIAGTVSAHDDSGGAEVSGDTIYGLLNAYDVSGHLPRPESGSLCTRNDQFAWGFNSLSGFRAWGF